MKQKIVCEFDLVARDFAAITTTTTPVFAVAVFFWIGIRSIQSHLSEQ